jgi:hypothetical protein
LDMPTAIQSVLETHETPVSTAPLAPEGITGLSTSQLWPSHRSASGS